MSPELFDAALELASRMDQRFGQRTRSASIRDVIYVTRATLPHLRRAFGSPKTASKPLPELRKGPKRAETEVGTSRGSPSDPTAPTSHRRCPNSTGGWTP